MGGCAANKSVVLVYFKKVRCYLVEADVGLAQD